jgi:hypothetical protein
MRPPPTQPLHPPPQLEAPPRQGLRQLSAPGRRHAPRSTAAPGPARGCHTERTEHPEPAPPHKAAQGPEPTASSPPPRLAAAGCAQHQASVSTPPPRPAGAPHCPRTTPFSAPPPPRPHPTARIPCHCKEKGSTLPPLPVHKQTCVCCKSARPPARAAAAALALWRAGRWEAAARRRGGAWFGGAGMDGQAGCGGGRRRGAGGAPRHGGGRRRRDLPPLARADACGAGRSAPQPAAAGLLGPSSNTPGRFRRRGMTGKGGKGQRLIDDGDLWPRSVASKNQSLTRRQA